MFLCMFACQDAAKPVTDKGSFGCSGVAVVDHPTQYPRLVSSLVVGYACFVGVRTFCPISPVLQAALEICAVAKMRPSQRDYLVTGLAQVAIVCDRGQVLYGA